MQSGDALVDLANIPDAAKDAHVMHKAGALRRLWLRFPALITTLALELVVATIIQMYTDTFNRYPLLISMQPVISAISGNVGLQASSANVRALALGIYTPDQLMKAVLPEAKAAISVGLTIGTLTGVIACVWYHLAPDDPTGSSSDAFVFGSAIWLGMFFSVLSAGISGSAAPLLFKRMNCDPSALAGPLETAFQDIIGGSVLLALSAYILKTFAHHEACPSDDLPSCLHNHCMKDTMLTDSVWASVNTTCMAWCVNFDWDLCG